MQDQFKAGQTNRSGMTISPHRVRCFLALKNATGWLTNDEIARRAKVSKRCARAYSKLFVEQDIAERLPVFPAHQFRLRGDASINRHAIITDLEQAAGVFGISIKQRTLALV